VRDPGAEEIRLCRAEKSTQKVPERKKRGACRGRRKEPYPDINGLGNGGPLLTLRNHIKKRIAVWGVQIHADETEKKATS